MPVLDASIVVARFRLDDLHHSISRSWMQGSRQSGDAWHVPAILLAELAAAITRGSQGAESGEEVAESFLALAGITWWPVTTDLARRAARIASAQHIRGCDAVYVALAAQLGETLVTFDRQQSLRAGAVVRVLVPV